MQVWPKNELMRKHLKHANGTGFRETGPADWPDDSFTHRRVTDGDVVTSEPKEAKKPVT
jgi:hypothetical protein